MARPQKTGLDYFPLDTGLFEDRKIRVLTARFGAAGAMAYLYILCTLYKDKGYYLRPDEDYLLMAAQDMGIKVQELEVMLEFMLERNLFDPDLYRREGVLTSRSIQCRYQAAKKGCKRVVTVLLEIWMLPLESTESFITGIKSGNSKEYPENNECISEKNGGFSPEKLSKGKEKKEEYRKKEKTRPSSLTVILGNNGWVVLCIDSYERLAEEYGRAEVERAAAYVDILCQSNGNKYRWTDFEPVLARAIREKWGMQKKSKNLDFAQRTYSEAYFESERKECERLIESFAEVE